MSFLRYRMRGFIGRTLAGILLLPGVLLICARLCAQSVPMSPAMLQGIITNGANGLPVVGAKVTINGIFTLSTSGGVYTIAVNPAGTFPVSCTKAGFDNYSSLPLVFVPGGSALLNIQLWENLNPPVNVSVFLDSAQQHVPVSWDAPAGNYELIYDDGVQDNFTIWSAQGNMNAMKFTPVGYPAKLTGGSINIGISSNYPAGGNPLVPFQVRIYDATGTGGTPGNSLAGPFEIIPTALGWIEFILPVPVVISNGSFFIAMVQGGNAPNAAGIAIDETNPQFRSYSRFTTGGSTWYPAGGNFMIRARCEGPGGPILLADEPLTAGINNVYRLRQGEEQNPTAWIMIGSTMASAIIDSNWFSLPCGPYRWGVKAQFTGNRWSPVSFSNILGKCWTATVNIHLALSCDSTSRAGTSMRLVNMAYPDTSYSAVFDSGGIVSFPNVWKGTYRLTIVKFGYDTLFQSVPVAAPVSLDLILLQVKNPPANLVVNDRSLMARWDVPRFEKLIFSEKWNGGSFSANSWTIEGGTSWTISTLLGNPSPSAMFGAIPHQVNYSQSLISRNISGQNSTLLKLKYDIYLDNYGTTSLNQMAVEIWDGSAWHVLKDYSNSSGDLPWTSEDLDISPYTGLDFRIRFHAVGGDSYDINNWNVDNIGVVATEPAQEQANCILGYYFYLGNVISGYTTKNAYPIPGNQVQYGQTYNACVRALYGSGYSDFACTTFTSAFLYPVLNLHGNAIEDVAYIAWEKPLAQADSSYVVPPGLVGYTIYRDDSVIATISNPDSLSFYDTGLEPGYYQYGVAARYDLTGYGFPGTFGESLPAGPLHITINWGRQLPFYESWNSGTFSFNEWRFNPDQGNWILDPDEGIPSPAANFRWQPPLVNYDCSLESPSFSGLPFNCAAIWMDFDLKLNDRNYTGTEKMIVEAYYNNAWHKKAEIRNNGSLSWTNYHLDISPARGKGFRVRFRASGQNSSEILNWYIDNVNIYPVCYPATNLEGEAMGFDTRLTWHPPACYGGNLLNEGFEESFFPPNQWTKQTMNPSATWMHTSDLSLTGVHSGSYSAGLNWDYNHQDEWLIAKNIYINGDLTFWSYAFQGSLHLDHYYIKVSSDQGATWDVLMDMSALPPYPGSSGVNAWITPYHVDLSMYAGETVDIAWHAVDGDGNGLWYPWAIDDCSIGADDHMQPVIGYDIYRKAPGANGFGKINPALVTDTVWIDSGLTPGQYLYFVQSQFVECERASNTDTIMVDVITGIGGVGSVEFTVYPNPVSDFFTIRSATALDEIRLYEASGRLAGNWFPAGKKIMTVDTQDFHAGIYLLMVHAGREIKTVKICIIK
ncbi:MAG: choice-of-anchor J domain-containing protein [Bacteroidetes bacterium]|nr:choice-of-anchor J domain-containing protein [Bacteroidota bacterium]